jgi:hypothetical protein
VFLDSAAHRRLHGQGWQQASVGEINFTPAGNFMFNTDGT